MSENSATTFSAPTSLPALALPRLTPWRVYVDIGVVIAALATANLIAHFTTAWANVVTVPAVAVGLLLMARARGLGWAELGLGREHLRSGARYAAVAIVVVATVIGLGALLPLTLPMFLNNHYATLSGALLASMIIIPLQTVIPEELAFRGVLHGTLNRAWGLRGVAAAGSLLFGLWHITTSLGLTSGNVGFSRIFGGGVVGMLAGVVLAVLATAAAGFVFTWLRRRSGSLIAPIALHWSFNGIGALAAAVVWQLSLPSAKNCAYVRTLPRIHSRITEPRTAVNSVNHQPPAAVSTKKLSRKPPMRAPAMPVRIFVRIPEPPPLTRLPAIQPASAPMTM